jgi:hypothetical protein
MMNIRFASIARLLAFDAPEFVASKYVLSNSAPILLDCSRQAHLALVHITVDRTPCRAVIEAPVLDPVRSTLHNLSNSREPALLLVDPMPSDEIDLAAMAETLARSPDYRVLRRLTPRTEFASCDGQATRVGILIDVETTGLNTAQDEIIEL